MNSVIREGRGWVRIERTVWDHPLFADEQPVTRREAWLWLIAHAEYEGSGRGEVVMARSALAKVWHWDRRQVRHFLEVLESEGMVSLAILGATRRAVTRISILNYDAFQASVYAGARNAPESRPNRARNTEVDSDAYPTSAPETRPKRARNAPESSDHLPETRPKRARNTEVDSDAYPTSAPESRPNHAHNCEIPPHPPKKEQINKEQYPSSISVVNPAGATSPASFGGGGGAKPIPDRLVDWGQCRDGVVMLRFRGRPPRPILAELKLCDMTYDAESMTWLGSYSDDLRAMVKSLIPAIDTRGWGEDAPPPEPAKTAEASRQTETPRPVDPTAAELLDRYHVGGCPDWIAAATTVLRHSGDELVLHTTDEAAQLLIARDIDRPSLAEDGIRSLVIQCDGVGEERMEVACG